MNTTFTQIIILNTFITRSSEVGTLMVAEVEGGVLVEGGGGSRGRGG